MEENGELVKRYKVSNEGLCIEEDHDHADFLYLDTRRQVLVKGKRRQTFFLLH